MVQEYLVVERGLISHARAHTHTHISRRTGHTFAASAGVSRAGSSDDDDGGDGGGGSVSAFDGYSLSGSTKEAKKKKIFFLPLSLAPRCHVPFIVVYFNSRRIATKESLSTLLTFFFFSYQIRSRERKKELNFKVLDKKISFKNIPLIISPLAAAMVAAAGFFFFFHVSTHNIGWNH